MAEVSGVEKLLDELDQESDPAVLRDAVRVMVFRYASLRRGLDLAVDEVLADANTADDVALVEGVREAALRNEQAERTALALQLMLQYAAQSAVDKRSPE